MYNYKYINDFDKNMYNEYLSDSNKLKELADSYINQYNNPTYECTIAFKESLDHYVLKQLEENESTFKNTQFFSNYLNYINYIFSKRVNNNVQLEYNTNILFQHQKTKDIILSYYNDDVRNRLLEIIDRNDNIINEIYNKMIAKIKLTESELNLISDYLYTRRDLNDNRHSYFVEYILNMHINSKTTPQIVASYISYLPKIFGDGCENRRIILSNGISKSNDLKTVLPSELGKNKERLNYFGLYSHDNYYVSMDWNILKNIDLNSDLSLNIPRTLKLRDIYWLTMTSFHELTHQLQNSLMKSNEFNSSGLSLIIKKIRRNKDDNVLNHDSIESEIEADENAWDKMYSFIIKYRNRNKFQIDKEEISSQLKKCIINKDSALARRAIQTKHNTDDRFFASDMTEIRSLFSSNPKYPAFFKNMINTYPMLNIIFDENCNIKTTVMFDKNLTSKNNTGNDENILFCELANYILNEGYNTLKTHLVNDNLSKNQIINLLNNVYNTYHLEKKFLNSLSKLDFSQLEETKTNFDYKNPDILRKKYLEKFKNVANLVYKERELITIINKKYPEYNIESSVSSKYAIWNYEDMFNHLYKISNEVLEEKELDDILAKYLKSLDPVLVNLAYETQKMIGIQTEDDSIKPKNR